MDNGKDQNLEGKGVGYLRAHLHLLGNVSRLLTSGLDLPAVLQEVVDSACQLTGARYGALLLYDASGRLEQFVTHGVTPEERQRIGQPPQGSGLLGWHHQLRQPLRLADLTKHPRAVGFPPHHPAMKTLLGAPLRIEGEALGNLYLTEKAGGQEFTAEDEDLVVLFAAQAWVAIQNARLFAQERQARAQAEAAQQALRASERQLQDILDNTTAVVYIKDAQGRYLFVNRQYETLFGVKMEEVRGKTDYDLFPAAAADAFWANDRKVLQAAAPLDFDELVPHQDGLHIYLSSKFPLFDASGLPDRVCGISTDITERRKAREALDIERQRLQVLLDNAPVGVIVIEGRDRTAVFFNRELQRIVGFIAQPGEQMDRFEPEILYRKPDGAPYALEERPLERALFQGETVRAEEMVFELPDGRRVSVLVNATPVLSATGEVVGAIGIVQDLTPLEDVERLRSEFLGMVSHELRTPLAAIKGAAATVLGSKDPLAPEEVHELFEIINEQSDRLRDLVDNLLDMARIEAGALSVTPEPADLRVLVEDALALLARSVGPLQVAVHLPDGLPQVRADRRRIAQVLLNLLGNAVKFSPPGSPIAVEAQQDGMFVTVRVQDHGRGIPPEMLSHLFRKFSQVHADPAQRLGGTGLGLAISQGIVQAHGGRIWAESPGRGHGAVFSFTLPVAAEAAPAAEPQTAQRAAHLGRVRRAGERTRILAVDDDVQVLRVLQRHLREAGYHPLATSDPSEVMRLVEMEEPDLVLLDLRLPGTSGFEVLQRIREFSGVPVIFLTASDESDDAVRALKLGADDYITKPFSPTELLARIEASLRRRGLQDTVEVRAPLAVGDLIVNFADRRVTVGGKSVALSATEYKLLYELAANAGRVLTHDQILQRVWGPGYAGETELVRSFVRNLRRKLGDDARSPRYVFTEPQVGYRMAKD